MRVLLSDFLHRYRWWFLGGGVFCIFMSWLRVMDPDMPNFILMLALIGPICVAQDHHRGSLKVLAVLPLNRRTISRSCWIEAVVLAPALSFVVVSLGTLLAGLTGEVWYGLGTLLEMPLIAFAYAGSMYFFLTMMPPASYQNVLAKSLSVLAALFWGLLAGLHIFVASLSLDRGGGIVLVACGLALTVFSFFSSFLLIERRTALRPHAKKKRPAACEIRLGGGATGKARYWLESFSLCLLLSLGIMLFMTLIFSLSLSLMRGESPLMILTHRSSGHFVMVFLLIFLLAFGLGFQMRTLLGMRLWRTLPLSGLRLTLLLFLLPAGNVVAFLVVLSLFLFPSVEWPGVFTLAGLFPVILALAIVLFALLLHIGIRNLMLIVGVGGVFFTFFGILAAFRGAEEIIVRLSSLPVVVICILAAIVALWWGYRCIQSRSELYRPLTVAWGPFNAQR